MKKLLFAFLAAIVLTLIGCTDPDLGDDSGDPVAPGEYPEEGVEGEFVETMAFDPYWEDQAINQPEHMIHIGEGVCARIGSGDTINLVVDDIKEQTSNLESAEHLVESAIFTLCPEYIDNFEVYLESNSS